MSNKLYLYLILILAVFLPGCVIPRSTIKSKQNRSENGETTNLFNLSIQKSPPPDIQSVQLYRLGSPGNPPVIELGSNEILILEFDLLGDVAKQFRAEVTHYNRDWRESSLMPEFYLSGFNTVYINGGLKSLTQRPSYYHFSLEFPNNQFSFEVSGNYLLSIYDYETGDLLFSLPFFVHEDEGTLDTQVEERFAGRQDFRRQSQLFSQYLYPDFVEFPQFDLNFQYVQNQFWGRTKEVDFFDTSSPGQVQFHLDQSQSFVSDYTFNLLDLSTLSADGLQILNVEEATIPPKVILRRDVQNLSSSSNLGPVSRLGLPIDDRNATYAEVHFRLETSEQISPTEELYIVGDFNGWNINRRNRMRYDPNQDWWEGRALIKQGQYAYKYVIMDNGEVDDLTLDQSLISTRQQYLTLVYFRDPTRNYDRLLQVNQITSR